MVKIVASVIEGMGAALIVTALGMLTQPAWAMLAAGAVLVAKAYELDRGE